VAWSLLAVGMGAWAIGQIGWTIYETGFGIEPVAPSPLDGLFLLSSVLVIVGLLAMVRTPAGHLSHIRGAVEGLFIAGGFFLCSWSLLIGSVFEGSHTSTLDGLVNLAYPVLDAMALAAVFFVSLRRRQSAPAGLGLLALGIVCVAASDSSYWYLTETRPSFPGVGGPAPLGAEAERARHDAGAALAACRHRRADRADRLAHRWEHRIEGRAAGHRHGRPADRGRAARDRLL
jgi:4-amino-4-deoxy-L-arabinose transferase-like glycosyltransferase